MDGKRAAMILAGGRSERMGRPKAWLLLDGTPLLVRVVSSSQAACDRVVVVGSPGQDLPELPPGALRVDDPPEREHHGPLSGILTGLTALSSLGVELAYLGAVDTPYLDPAHIAFMLDALDHEHVAAAVPHSEREDGTQLLHGLAGAVRVPAALDTARALLQAGERSLQALYRALDTTAIPVASLPDPRVVRVCNTPEDWQEAERELRGQPLTPPRLP